MSTIRDRLQFTAMLVCKTCGRSLSELVSDDPRSLVFGIPTALLTAHAMKEHLSHALAFVLPERPMPEVWAGPDKRLTIACLVPSCRERFAEARKRDPKIVDAFELSTVVPIELVAALTVVYHSAHEGHALRVTWGEETWQSPGYSP